MSWTRSTFDPLTYSSTGVGGLSTGLGGGSLAINAVNSALGRVGVQGGTAIDLNGRVILQPFGAFSVWHEFAGSSSATATIAGEAIPITTTQIGTFYQATGGVALQIPNTGILGFIRGDVRVGDVEGYSILAGGRYTFQ
jgi:outer membrane autotransporter protein